MYYYPTHYYPYYYYPMYKYANLTPYLGAAGVGAGLGALGGAGVGALMGRGDWKKALKSALIGMVAGAVAGPAVYAGYSALFPGQAAKPASPVAPASVPPSLGGIPAAALREPMTISRDTASYMIQNNPFLYSVWETHGKPESAIDLQQILQSSGYNYLVRD
jgi:hypothetical protein